MILKKSLVKYSLVIPCYNESDNLPILVERCQALLNIRADIEVLLVDNGSTDDTHEVLGCLLKGLGQINLRTIRIHKNKGYGFGIISGLRECNGEVIGWTHADLQADPLILLVQYLSLKIQLIRRRYLSRAIGLIDLLRMRFLH